MHVFDRKNWISIFCFPLFSGVARPRQWIGALNDISCTSCRVQSSPRYSNLFQLILSNCADLFALWMERENIVGVLTELCGVLKQALFTLVWIFLTNFSQVWRYLMIFGKIQVKSYSFLCAISQWKSWSWYSRCEKNALKCELGLNLKTCAYPQESWKEHAEGKVSDFL